MIRYYKDPNSETIARGGNPAVYHGWVDLGVYPEFDDQPTSVLRYIDSILHIDHGLSMKRIASGIERAVQTWLDNVARRKGYDSANSCISYLGDTVVAQYDLDAQAMKVWRTNVWAYCFEQQQLAMSGQVPIPSHEDLLAQIENDCPPPW